MDTAENVREGSDRPRGGFLRSRSFALVRVAVSLAIVAGLVFKLSPDDIAHTVRDADPWLLLAALALMFASQAMVIGKWAFLLRARSVHAAGHAPGPRRCYDLGVRHGHAEYDQNHENPGDHAGAKQNPFPLRLVQHNVLSSARSCAGGLRDRVLANLDRRKGNYAANSGVGCM